MKTTFIRIENWGEIELDYLVDNILECKSKGTWKHETWKPTPSLNEKNGRTSQKYNGQKYDTEHFELIPNGWDHDHCMICTKTISDTKDFKDWETDGYKNGNEWVCKNCFNLFMVSDDIEKELAKYPKVQR